jgi:hypothetical protein
MLGSSNAACLRLAPAATYPAALRLRGEEDLLPQLSQQLSRVRLPRKQALNGGVHKRLVVELEPLLAHHLRAQHRRHRHATVTAGALRRLQWVTGQRAGMTGMGR